MKAKTIFRHRAGKAVFAALLLAFMSQPGAATLDRVKATGVAVACLDPEALPSSDSRLAPPGYDVEIAEEFAKSLGAKLQFNWFVHAYTSKVLRQLYDEKCDFVMGLPADRRLEGAGSPQLVLSNPYLMNGFAVVVANQIAARGLDDLRGQQIGVIMHTVPDFFVFDNGFARSLHAKQSEMFEALTKRTISAGIIWASTAGWLLKQHPEANLKILSELRPEFRFPMAVAVKKGDPAFLAAINRAIDSLIESGRRDEILAKYNFPNLVSKSAFHGSPVREAHNRHRFIETFTLAAPRSPFIRVVGGSRQMMVESPEASAPPRDDPAQSDPQQKGVPADQHESGFNLYHRACAKCHGRNAISGGIYPDLRKFQRPDEEFIEVVRTGRPGTAMPPWKDFLNPDEITRIRTYVKSVPAD